MNHEVLSHQEFLAFRLGKEEYGIDILKVQEIRSYDTVTCIANAPKFVKGVINLRGIIVPIIDMRIKFSRLKVLVVDDNADAAQMLAMLLEAAGHEVRSEPEPYRALACAGREVPDVCILDIGLPGMDGKELAARLRANPATSKSILIALTGYGQEADKKSILASGFRYHFVKPVDNRQLSELLKELRAE